jgi:glycoprotease/Kae1 family metallohydrolase
VLAIESSAHTLGVGIVEDGKVLANEKDMYKITDKGMIPVKVAEFHGKNVLNVIRKALKSASLKMDEIDAIGYTRGPGIGPCLRVGELAAATLAKKYHLPIYPVNHGVAHIEVARRMGGFSDPVALYVSGGNSQILALSTDPYKHYHIYGETLDIGIGNMLDNFARAAKLNPAWGSTVAKVAEGGSYVPLPYTVKGMDFTFTGLLTKAVESLEANSVSDIAFSMQETSFAMLCEATERALLLTGKDEIVLCGGVAQSARLQEMMKHVARSHSCRFYTAENQFNADNGAMIALVAEMMHGSQAKVPKSSLGIQQKYRIDAFRVTW